MNNLLRKASFLLALVILGIIWLGDFILVRLPAKYRAWRRNAEDKAI